MSLKGNKPATSTNVMGKAGGNVGSVGFRDDVKKFSPALVSMGSGKQYAHGNLGKAAINRFQFARHKIISHLIETRTFQMKNVGFDRRTWTCDLKQSGVLTDYMWLELLLGNVPVPVQDDLVTPIAGGFGTLSPLYEWMDKVQFNYITQPGIQEYPTATRFLNWCETSDTTFKTICYNNKETTYYGKAFLFSQNQFIMRMYLREPTYVLRSLKATLASYDTNTFKLEFTLKDYNQYIYVPYRNGYLNYDFGTPGVLTQMFSPTNTYPVIHRSEIRFSGKKKSEIQIFTEQAELIKFGLATIVTEPYRVQQELTYADVVTTGLDTLSKEFPALYGRLPGMVVSFQVVAYKKNVAGTVYCANKAGNQAPWRYYTDWSFIRLGGTLLEMGRTQDPFQIIGNSLPGDLANISWYGRHVIPYRTLYHFSADPTPIAGSNQLNPAYNSEFYCPLLFFPFSAEPFVNIQLKGDEGYINSNGDLKFTLKNCNAFLVDLITSGTALDWDAKLAPRILVTYLFWQEKMLVLSYKGLTKKLLYYSSSR